jgi:Haem-binding domain/Cytochrome P460
MRLAIKGIVILVLVFTVLQMVRPSIPQKPATAEVQAPPEIRAILEKDCYSCHSDQPRLAWFDQVVPAYWLVRSDVLHAREHLDFSTLGAKPPGVQRATLFEAVTMMQLGTMPLPRFLALHPEARVRPEDLEALQAYLAPWSARPGLQASAAEPASLAKGARASLPSVPPEFNGLPFDPSFEGWKPISTTDRGDNGTLRFVLGNFVAVQAAQTGNIHPWPEGTRFAKIAWQQQLGQDGLVHPGKFVQVELMVKDARLYRRTDGWGWGRWRGLDLAPHGHDAHFVTECTTCHLPVAGDDYVYTLPITPASVAGREVVNRRAAALPASLPWQPLGWNWITMYVDPATRTTAALFGNDKAMRAVAARERSSAKGTGLPYADGSVLALVTWAQRDDPHWFGARIPDVPLSVEFVQGGATSRYRRFAGTGLSEASVPGPVAADRTSFILNLPPAQLP